VNGYLLQAGVESPLVGCLQIALAACGGFLPLDTDCKPFTDSGELGKTGPPTLEEDVRSSEHGGYTNR
jgi:hypothetical protein